MSGPARKAPVLWKNWLCMKAGGASEDRSSQANTSMSKGRGQHLLDQGVLGGQDLVVRDQGQVDLDAEGGGEVLGQAAGRGLQRRRGGQAQLPARRPARGGQQVAGLVGVVPVGELAQRHPGRVVGVSPASGWAWPAKTSSTSRVRSSAGKTSETMSTSP